MTTPITIPAIAPPDRLLCLLWLADVGDGELFSGSSADAGVDDDEAPVSKEDSVFDEEGFEVFVDEDVELFDDEDCTLSQLKSNTGVSLPVVFTIPQSVCVSLVLPWSVYHHALVFPLNKSQPTSSQ